MCAFGVPDDGKIPTVSTAQPEQLRDPGRKGLLATIWVLLVLILAVIIAVVFAIRGDLRLPGAAADNAIHLEAADFPGDNPFSDTPLATAPDPVIATPLTNAQPAATVQPAVATGGGTPGLYGGSNDLGTCNVAQLKSFLASNPDKANAWVGAFNADPTLSWPGGTLTVADIPAFIDLLTPIVLVSDTMVTNHGFEGGVATPLQSVLQRGTAVLVDQYGVPRVKCYCGNPLLAPNTPAEPKFEGKTWEGFDPTKVVVVVPNNSPIVEFQIRIPAVPDGNIVTVQAGCLATGTCSTQPPTTTATPTPSATSTPSPSAAPPHTPVAPPAGAYCSDPFTGGSLVENPYTNTTNMTYDVYYYDDTCTPSYVLTAMPGDTGAVWSDLPNAVFVATSGSPDVLSVHIISDGGVWTIQ